MQNRTRVGSTTCEIPPCLPSPSPQGQFFSYPLRSLQLSSNVDTGWSESPWCNPASLFSLRLPFFVPLIKFLDSELMRGLSQPCQCQATSKFLNPTVSSASHGKSETQKLPLEISLLIPAEFIECCLEDESRWWVIWELTQKGWLQPCVTERLF